MLLRLQNFDINLKYVPGRDLKIADALSRSCSTIKSENDEFDTDINAHVYMLVKNINISDQQLVKFQNETDKDKELNILKGYIRDGCLKIK